MDTYRIEWKRSATKELRSLPTHMVQRIVEVVRVGHRKEVYDP